MDVPSSTNLKIVHASAATLTASRQTADVAQGLAKERGALEARGKWPAAPHSLLHLPTVACLAPRNKLYGTLVNTVPVWQNEPPPQALPLTSSLPWHVYVYR
jgi:hypothetical protein